AAKRNECSVFLFPSRVLDHHYGLGSYLIDYGPIPVYQLRSYKGRLSKKILQRMREGTFTSSRCGNRSQQSSKIVGHLHPHLQSREITSCAEHGAECFASSIDIDCRLDARHHRLFRRSEGC